MGEFTYEEQGTYTWLVYEMEEGEELDSLSLGMLTKNRVPGILPIVYTPINDNGYIKYNVSSRVSARDYLTGMVNKERMLGVFSGIISAMTSAESYMLDVNSLILDLGYIFVNVSNGEAHMICVPVMSREQKHMDLAGFFRNILFSVQFDPSENFDYVTLIVNYLNSTQMFSLAEFGKLVTRAAASAGTGFQQRTGDFGAGAAPGEVGAAPGVPGAGISPAGHGTGTISGGCISDFVSEGHGFGAPVKDTDSTGDFGGMAIPGGSAKSETQGKNSGEKPKKPGLFAGLKPRQKSEQGSGTGKTAKTSKTGKKAGKKNASQGGLHIPPMGETKKEEISSGPGDIPMTDDEIASGIEYGATADDFEMPGTASLRLLYITEGRTIMVSSFPFEIGREGTGLKIDISKTKISRRHAVITQAGGQFLITDFSKHGTFLNGERIPQGEPRVLENGMRILLKTEEFEVKIDRI